MRNNEYCLYLLIIEVQKDYSKTKCTINSLNSSVFCAEFRTRDS